MGNVIIGATMSLDGFMNDRHGEVSRLYRTWKHCEEPRYYRVKYG